MDNEIPDDVKKLSSKDVKTAKWLEKVIPGYVDCEWKELSRAEVMNPRMGNTKTSKMKGLITFFINVGQLAPEKAMFFAKSLHEQTFYPELKQRLADSGYEVIMLPTRDQPTQIGVVPL